MNRVSLCGVLLLNESVFFNQLVEWMIQELTCWVLHSWKALH